MRPIGPVVGKECWVAIFVVVHDQAIAWLATHLNEKLDVAFLQLGRQLYQQLLIGLLLVTVFPDKVPVPNM